MKKKKAKRKKKAATNVAVRDNRGRFVKGCPGGPGNPTLMRIAKLRSEIQQAVTPAEIRAVFRRLLTKAKAGDVESAKLVLNYAVGKPIAMPADADENNGIGGVSLDVTSSAGCADAAKAVLAALSAGKVDADSAMKVAGIIELSRRALEQAEISERLTALENERRYLE